MANETTQTTLAGLMETIQADAIAAFRTRAALLTACSGQDAMGAKTVQFGSTAVPAASSQHTESGQITKVAVTVAAVTVTPKPFPVWVKATIESLRAGGNVQRAIGNALGGGVARGLDTEITGLYSSFTNTVGTAAAALTVKNLMQASAIIDSIGYVGEKVVVLHPGQYVDIMDAMLGKFTPARNDQIVSAGFMGNAFGWEWYVSPWVAVDGSDDATGAMYIKEAIAAAWDSGPGGNELVYIDSAFDAEYLSRDVAAWSNMDAALLNDGAGVGIISDVADSISSI